MTIILAPFLKIKDPPQSMSIQILGGKTLSYEKEKGHLVARGRPYLLLLLEVHRQRCHRYRAGYVYQLGVLAPRRRELHNATLA
jgi:hypothetical protein